MSINVGYARMTAAMDICNITSLAAKMGVTTNSGEPLTAVPSIALGSQEVTALQMANAYATFAAHGVYCKPIAIDKILDADGAEMKVPSASCSQVMTAEAADQVSLTLTTALSSSGTGRGAILADGRPAAGKTGTTDDMDNAWFVGYTPSLSAAVWLGHSDGYYAMNRQVIGGRYYAMYGSDAPAPLWKTYMDAALTGTPTEQFNQVSLGTPPAPMPQEKYEESETTEEAPAAEEEEYSYEEDGE